MPASYRLTEAARADLAAIAEYSRETWGATQATAFVSLISARMAWLAEMPGVGRPRPELRPGTRCFPESDYLIYYRAGEDGIVVLRVRHQSRDPIKHESEL